MGEAPPPLHSRGLRSTAEGAGALTGSSAAGYWDCAGRRRSESNSCNVCHSDNIVNRSTMPIGSPILGCYPCFNRRRAPTRLQYANSCSCGGSEHEPFSPSVFRLECAPHLLQNTNSLTCFRECMLAGASSVELMHWDFASAFTVFAVTRRTAQRHLNAGSRHARCCIALTGAGAAWGRGGTGASFRALRAVSRRPL